MLWLRNVNKWCSACGDIIGVPVFCCCLFSLLAPKRYLLCSRIFWLGIFVFVYFFLPLTWNTPMLCSCFPDLAAMLWEFVFTTVILHLETARDGKSHKLLISPLYCLKWFVLMSVSSVFSALWSQLIFTRCITTLILKMYLTKPVLIKHKNDVNNDVPDNSYEEGRRGRLEQWL